MQIINKKGFTLIELLGIIVLIGLILLVAVPLLIESNNQANINQEEDMRESIKIAAINYISTCGSLGLCDNEKETYNQILNGTKTDSITIEINKLTENGFLQASGDLPGTITVENDDGKIVVYY